MLDVKNNFRNKYNDILFSACGDVEETQTHVLEECRAIHTQEDTKVREQDIFKTDPKQLSTTADKVAKIIDSISSVQLAHPRLEPPWNQVKYTMDRIE